MTLTLPQLHMMFLRGRKKNEVIYDKYARNIHHWDIMNRSLTLLKYVVV